MSKKKNAAAVQLGRKGGKARASRLTPAERQDSARRAVQQRWERAKYQLCICGHTRQRHREKREGLPHEICLETYCTCMQFSEVPE